MIEITNSEIDTLLTSYKLSPKEKVILELYQKILLFRLFSATKLAASYRKRFEKVEAKAKKLGCSDDFIQALIEAGIEYTQEKDPQLVKLLVKVIETKIRPKKKCEGGEKCLSIK